MGVTDVQELQQGIELPSTSGGVGRDLAPQAIPQLLPPVVFQVYG